MRWDASETQQLKDASGATTVVDGEVHTWQESTRSKGIDTIKVLVKRPGVNMWGYLKQDAMGRNYVLTRGFESTPSNRKRI